MNSETRSSDNKTILQTVPDAESELSQLATKKQFLALLDRAYQYLMRREHSEHELRRKLARWDELDQIDQAIALLKERNAQSDLRYAEHVARVRFNAGKGPAVLKQEFSQHKIDVVIVEEVMAEYAGRWSGLAETVRQKKFGPEAPSDYKTWAKQARFLQQRGFSSNDIPGYDC